MGIAERDDSRDIIEVIGKGGIVSIRKKDLNMYTSRGYIIRDNAVKKKSKPKKIDKPKETEKSEE